MDVLTALDHGADYSPTQLQLILGAWVLSTVLQRRDKISVSDGHVSEEDYDKRSIYSLLYSLYRTMGDVKSESGVKYELTFNTWGYAWPAGWGPPPNSPTDPQRFGRNAYSGLFEFGQVKDYVEHKRGKVHVVEMGCGTGAGAHHVCTNVLPACTYEAIDMQEAAIRTCRRKFVPELAGRLAATCADVTRMPSRESSADLVAINETHVAERTGYATEHDRQFFATAHRVLKPGGFLVWGNAIPDPTWAPCFEVLESLGMRQVEARDVTKEAIIARDEDEQRVNVYVDQCIDAFFGFKIPVLGSRKRREAEQAMKNFYRNPGTKLYENMKDGTDSYRVVLFQKQSS